MRVEGSIKESYRSCVHGYACVERMSYGTCEFCGIRCLVRLFRGDSPSQVRLEDVSQGAVVDGFLSLGLRASIGSVSKICRMFESHE